MRSYSGWETKRLVRRPISSGFTLTDTAILIVILVLVLVFVLGILLPVLAKNRMMAFLPTCRTHLMNIGKAMLIYAHDYDGKLPRAGSRTSTWGQIAWNAPTRRAAYSLDPNDQGGQTSVSSNFYLLVKYANANSETFICAGDMRVRKWSGERVNGATPKLTDCWDFGSNPQTHCSYTYHWPFGGSPLTSSGEPGRAVAADRNPWIAAPGLKAKSFPTSSDGKFTFRGKSVTPGDQLYGVVTAADQLYGNATTHQEDGQNVLFLDGHVSFEQRSFCSLEDDNIYTRSAFPDKGDPLGVPPVFSTAGPPPNRKDSVLVHDPPTWPTPLGQR